MRLPRQPSDLEAHLARDIKAMGLPVPETEYRFAQHLSPKRQFRFDFAWPDYKVACEVEGGTFMGKGHTGGTHFESDCIKHNLAACTGWLVVRVTKRMIEDGRGVDTVLAALLARGGA